MRVPPGSAKLAKAPPPRLTRRANAPQLPGSWAVRTQLRVFQIFKMLSWIFKLLAETFHDFIKASVLYLAGVTILKCDLAYVSQNNRGFWALLKVKHVRSEELKQLTRYIFLLIYRNICPSSIQNIYLHSASNHFSQNQIYGNWVVFLD